MGNKWLNLLIYIFFAYLLGSIPFGFIVGKIRGKDIRKEGSGNIGATNVARTLGPFYGGLVLILDALKGYLAVYALKYFIGDSNLSFPLTWHFFGAMAAVLGHSYSPFLGFTGGKSVAVSFGAALCLFPSQTLLGLFTFVVTISLTKIASISSLTAVSLVAFLVLVDANSRLPAKIFVLVAAILIFYRHRSNIVRIFEGTENTLGVVKKR